MIIHSVVIPHYTKSGTALLERAVTSVPDRADIEVIVVDNSPEEININLFNDRSNVQIAYSDKRKGAGCARNRGIELARGKWLHFLDADDFYTENAFNEFDRYKDSDYDIIFFKMTSCYSDTLEPARRHLQNAKLIDDFLEGKNINHLRFSEVPWAKMVKASLVFDNSIRYDEVRVSNDVVFGLKIGLYANNIMADKAIVSCITISKGSLTNIESLSNIETRFNVALRKNKILKDHGYKKMASIMKYIFQAKKYGLNPAIKLLLKGLFAGDLFVGCKNWFFTWYRIKFKSDDKSDYIIIE